MFAGEPRHTYSGTFKPVVPHFNLRIRWAGENGWVANVFNDLEPVQGACFLVMLSNVVKQSHVVFPAPALCHKISPNGRFSLSI